MHSSTSHAPLTFTSASIRGALKMRSILGSFVAVVRKVCCPVGIHLLALLIELARGCKLVMAHSRSGVHGALRGVEHQQVNVRGYLEVLPGNRDVFVADPENPAPRDRQIGDLACLRTHHE